MRFWLKDSERRPDPAPVKTDDRKAFLAGSLAWLVALVLVLFLAPGWLIWTCVAGLVIGGIGLGWSIWRHRTQ
ncbi:MAG: DUF2530 domain-containing protein [Actinobacteria bacterium]|nr:DUF2530 domain-containing protein [Actinomycetota bacterium]